MSESAKDEYDTTVDYYAILGVAKNASANEIKKAHVKLALENHPDMLSIKDRNNSLVNDGGERFRRISEAWKVLSKPTLKEAYDTARNVSATGGRGNVGVVPNLHIDVSSFTVQEAHYNNAVKAAAMSNWREVQDKYQTAKWRRMSLDEKKLSRSKSITGAGGSIFGILGAGMLIFGIAAGIVTFMRPSKPKSHFSKNNM